MAKITNTRLKKKARMRVVGTSERPRLSVFRSLNNLTAQLIDDSTGKTLGSASSIKEKGSRTVKAKSVGEKIAKVAVDAKIKTVVFDRNGFRYQGVVSILAAEARNNGLLF